jgi:hypothetical protein
MDEIWDEFEQMGWFGQALYFALFFIIFVLVDLPMIIANKICDL